MDEIICKLRVTMHDYKGSAPVSVKEECTTYDMYLCKQSSVGIGACLSSSTKSPVYSYLCVYVMEAFLKVLKRSTPRDVCLCTQDQARVGMGVLYVCLIFTLQKTYLWYMYVNTAKRLRLHKAFSLLLIMKYFVLKIVSHSYTITPCNLANNSPPIAPHKQNHPQDSLTNWIASQAPKADAYYKCYVVTVKKKLFIYYNLYLIALICSLIVW